ncbi:MAG TPA: hypothetical protein DCS63_06495 [Elusimicrobia bacterium]|nr:hypothetical protein [Elusimicrobiota bacterium]
MKINMSFLRVFLLAAAVYPLAPLTAGAGAPLKINFQGRLAESGLAAEGSKTFVFKIYDTSSGGNLVWTSASQALTLTQGVFSAALSAGTPAALSTAVFSGARYVEMTVDGVTLAPRQEMMSAPYALVAQALAPDAVMPSATIAAGSVNDSHVSLTTAAINSGKFGDDRVYISTGAFYGGFNAAGKLVQLDESGRLGEGIIPVLTTAAITSGKFGDDRVYISTGAFFGGFNAADKLVKLDASGRLGVGVAPTSALTVGGPISLPIKTVTANYTITENDSTILADASTNIIELTLPDAVAAKGRVYTVKKIDDSVNGVSAIAVDPQLIDGAVDISFYLQWNTAVLQSDGSNWIVISILGF